LIETALCAGCFSLMFQKFKNKAKIKSMLAQIEKNRIRVYFYIASILTIVLMTSFLLFQYSQSLKREYENKIEQLSSSIIESKQKFIQNAVEQVIYLIESERHLANEEYFSQSLSKEQIDAIAIRRVSRLIRDMRLIDDGYIWVNRIVNYQGGESYAIRQIHPNLPETEGMQLSTNTTDIKGNRPYQEELDGINKNGELFFDYYFKKLDSEKISHKLSFAKLYKPFDWVVATGVYLDDVDQLIASETIKMEETYKYQLLKSISITALALLLSSSGLIFFDKLISSLISSYQEDIKEFTTNLVEEKEKTERALKEIKTLQGIIPICQHCKGIRDDKGDWNRLEQYISTRTDAQFSHGICDTCLKEHYSLTPSKKSKKNTDLKS